MLDYYSVISLYLDVTRREDVSGPLTVAWIVFLIIVPVIGILTYIALRPKLSREERHDVDRYKAAVTDDPSAADQIAALARRRVDGSLTEDEYQVLKAAVIS